MNKNANAGKTVVIILIVLLLFFAWGFFGGQQAKEIGTTCDFGLGEFFCWNWHKNIIGQLGDGLENTGNAVYNFFNGS